MQDDITMPFLTLDPGLEESVAAVAQPSPQAPVQEPDPAPPLTPEEQKMVDNFAAKIDLSNSEQILRFGASAQKKMADFSQNALENVRTKDLGEIGEVLAGVVTELRDFDEPEDKSFLGLFKKQASKVNAIKTRYDKAATNIEHICSNLESHQVRLLKDVAMLDKLYDLNKAYFKEISMYILAGKKKLSAAQAGELPRLRNRAAQSGLPEDAQEANDYANLCNRFEKKLHDLELTRMISIQMAPQLRLVQNNDTQMVEKIQSTIVNTIPLWKSQMALTLGIAHSQQAVKAQREVTDMTNELLRRNAETLKMATIETAKESERGVVDMETLRTTNEALISTLDEVMRIQQEGRQKRGDAEVELRRIESELKKKLLEL